MVLKHVRDTQILESNQPELFDQVVTDLMSKIVSAVGYPLMGPLDDFESFPPLKSSLLIFG